MKLLSILYYTRNFVMQSVCLQPTDYVVFFKIVKQRKLVWFIKGTYAEF
jgi:hypothetical protein